MSEKDTPKERPSSPCEARATAQINGISVKNALGNSPPISAHMGACEGGHERPAGYGRGDLGL